MVKGGFGGHWVAVGDACQGATCSVGLTQQTQGCSCSTRCQSPHLFNQQGTLCRDVAAAAGVEWAASAKKPSLHAQMLLVLTLSEPKARNTLCRWRWTQGQVVPVGRESKAMWAGNGLGHA